MTTYLQHTSELLVIEALAQALEARDPYTAHHGARVEELAGRIASAIGLPKQDLHSLGFGARLHDLGKIGVPDNILLKPGPLTELERGLMRIHTRIGRGVLERVQGLEHLLPIVELHHENFDGSGYPYALRGDQIPLLARIVRVADTYDALVTRRVYRNAYSRAEAVEFITSRAGRDFDPNVAAAFKEVIQDAGHLRTSGEVVAETELVWTPD